MMAGSLPILPPMSPSTNEQTNLGLSYTSQANFIITPLFLLLGSDLSLWIREHSFILNSMSYTGICDPSQKMSTSIERHIHLIDSWPCNVNLWTLLLSPGVMPHRWSSPWCFGPMPPSYCCLVKHNYSPFIYTLQMNQSTSTASQVATFVAMLHISRR